jgi:hypothetical protein
MGLIDLKTDLKSLRYGKDKQGGGSSNQPYIVTPIPDGLTANGPDFLLRQGALRSSLVDVERLTKWFTDFSSINGLLFTTKQIALERLNPKIPGGLKRIYSPTSTLAQVGALPLGAHLNKQGLDPFVSSYTPGGSGDGYFNYTLRSNNNDPGMPEGDGRLTLLYKIKLNDKFDTEVANFGNITYGINSNQSNILLSYPGGPNSVLGLGKTNILLQNPTVRSYTNPDGSNPNDVYTFKLEDFFNQVQNRAIGLYGLTDYRVTINKTAQKQVLPETAYEVFTREKTYDTSPTLYKVGNYSSLFNPNNSIASDKLNKLFSLPEDAPEVSQYKNKDLISFYFEVLNPKTNTSDFLFFRAYITDLGDNYKADWQNYKYVGRAENFYKYSGFSRDVSLSFTVYAHSREEMKPIYDKLNYLAGVTAPTYSDKGFMMGNILKITVGNYFNSMPGVLNSINLKPSFEAGWDINRNKDGEILTPKDKEYVGQLPRLIDVSMAFTPIHTFTPKYQEYFINTPIRQQLDTQASLPAPLL